MSENRLHEVVYLFVYTICLLLVLSLIPPFTLGDFNYRRVSLFSDILSEKPQQASGADSVRDAVIAEPVQSGKKPCPAGITCLEDFSSEGTALRSFLDALDETSDSPVRIAFFGDSFIEGDILTASLRDTLQRVYGGRGPGFVPITSEVAKFRSTIGHDYSGWKIESIINKAEEGVSYAFGPLGNSAIPEEGNRVEYRPGKSKEKLQYPELLYTSDAVRRIRVTIDDTTVVEKVLAIAPVMGRERLANRPVHTVKVEVLETDSIHLFGVTFEKGAGIYVDNMAMRGNSGMALSRISSSVWREYNRDGAVKLVVLQYGLNVVSEKDSTDYGGYASSMVRVVEKIKLAFPKASILIVSVSDRSSNQDGTFRTMPGILAMRLAQRRLAQKTGVAFWDLFQAMGGENSMPGFVNRQPPWAGKDYTHMNFRGGQYLAKKLAEAIEFERHRHEVP